MVFLPVAFFLVSIAATATATAKKTTSLTSVLHEKSKRSQSSVNIDHSYFVEFDHEHISFEAMKEKVVLARSSSSSLSSLSQQSFRMDPLYHVFSGAIVQGVEYHHLSSLPHVTRIIKDSIKRIRLPPKESATQFRTATETFASATATSFKSAATTVPGFSWGLDRINQLQLPLDHNTSSVFRGDGVDVYVVDTGIDTNHIEFSSVNNTSTRLVRNIYNAFIHNKDMPSEDTDDVGHGTHCAGTIGGNTIGVSPHATIFGLKILNSDGEGSTTNIVAALDKVAAMVHETKRPSVVSMSLGGSCETSDCSKDTLVQSVEKLSKMGIVVSVAAGNEGCNACNGSPNAAPHAITVGASDVHDKLTYFSNYGPCVDVVAPGLDVVSSCAHFLCHSDADYVKFSGTSMACPHVAGVVAQVMQKFTQVYQLPASAITSQSVLNEIECESSKNQLQFDVRDTVTKNMLLRTPLPSIIVDVNFSSHQGPQCSFADTCDSQCFLHGYCLPLHPFFFPAAFNISGNNKNAATPTNDCFCEDSYSGASCTLPNDSVCSQAGSGSIAVKMYDSFGDGWSFASFTISDPSSGRIVHNAFDSLCYGDSDSRQYCLASGVDHTFVVSRGQYPAEIAWEVCDVKGGAPTMLLLSIDSHKRCSASCPLGHHMTQLTLRSETEDGWNGAYYSVVNEATGLQMYGGTLIVGEEETHSLCLPMSSSSNNNNNNNGDSNSGAGCSLLFLESRGLEAESVRYSICGNSNSFGANDFVSVCIDHAGHCTATNINNKFAPLKQTCASTTTTTTTSAAASNIPFFLFDSSFHGFDPHQLEFTAYRPLPFHNNNNNNMSKHDLESLPLVIANKGFVNMADVCLPDGCFDFSFHSHNNNKTTSTTTNNNMWSACGHVAKTPSHGIVCVERDYNLCYGLSGCLDLKSYAHRSDRQQLVTAQFDDYYNINVLIENRLVHGVSDLCSYREGEYWVMLGTGKYFHHHNNSGNNNVDAKRNTFQLCGQSLSFPYIGTMTVAANESSCSLTPLSSHTKTCAANTVPQVLLKVDTYAEGWGSGYYTITSNEQQQQQQQQQQTTTQEEAYNFVGSLRDGEFDVDWLCLPVNRCYSLSFHLPYPEDSLFAFCGLVASASDVDAQPQQRLSFCITKDGCSFTSDAMPSDYDTTTDDDFPAAVQRIPPTLSPAGAPNNNDNSDFEYETLDSLKKMLFWCLMLVFGVVGCFAVVYFSNCGGIQVKLQESLWGPAPVAYDQLSTTIDFSEDNNNNNRSNRSLGNFELSKITRSARKVFETANPIHSTTTATTTGGGGGGSGTHEFQVIEEDDDDDVDNNNNRNGRRGDTSSKNMANLRL